MCLGGSLRHEVLAVPLKKRLAILTGISLIAVVVQLIRTSRRLHMLVGLDCIHPKGQPTSLLSIWPSSVWFQDPPQPNNPRGSLNIHKGHLRAHEEGSLGMRHFEQLLHRVSQLLRLLDLFLLVLLLQYTVETRHDMPIDLEEYQ